MMNKIIILITLALGGCASTTPPPVPPVITQRVEVPVPVKCAPMLGPEPMYPAEGEYAAAPDIFEAVKLYKRDRLLRVGRDAEKSAVIRGCSGDGH